MTNQIVSQTSAIAQGFMPGRQVTMSSLELVGFVNQHRREVAQCAGSEFPSEEYPELAHRSLMAKVPVVLGEAAANFLATDQYTNGTGGSVQRNIYRFPKREACLMAMSYSYDLQAKVFDRMTALEAGLIAPAFAIPQSLPDALRLAADLAEQNTQIAVERDQAIATKAQIGSKREATAMATAANAKRETAKLRDELGRNRRHATVIAVERATGLKFPKNAYVALRKWCKKNDAAAVDVVDDRYGSVKAWPAGAWLAQFDIDLSGLFDSGLIK